MTYDDFSNEYNDSLKNNKEFKPDQFNDVD